ncbi:Beta-barrel assembly-enhancing protease [compost metagenome]
MLYQAEGRSALVEPAMRDALRRDPDFLPAQVALAQWLDGNYRTEEARNLFQQAIERHPDSGLLRHDNGLALIRRGERDAALEELKQAARLEPDNAQFNYVLAIALQDTGERKAAIEQLQALLKRQPGNRTSRLTLIEFLETAGEKDQAQALREELRQLNPDDPEAAAGFSPD